jgi:hypothetical protein
MVINHTHSSFCFVATSDKDAAETSEKMLKTDDLPLKILQ